MFPIVPGRIGSVEAHNDWTTAAPGQVHQNWKQRRNYIYAERDLKIDDASLVQKRLWLDMMPAYEYKDKQRTDSRTSQTVRSTTHLR